MRFTSKTLCLGATVALAACQQPGANLQANVYKAGQVNQQQDAMAIRILSVLPARIEVDNEQAKATAQLVGGLAGGLGGGLLGNSIGHNRGTNALLGGAGGGAIGVMAGSLVPDKALVEGVSLTYMVNGRMLNSAQVGRICEYTVGDTILVSTGPGETRVQPNTTCPLPPGSKA